jgi:hypothetical protein
MDFIAFDDTLVAMAYRSDLEAMEARLAGLDAEVARKVQERDDVARLIDEAHHRERREALYADLASGGPERRLRRNALIALGAVSATVIGVLSYRELHKRTHSDDIMDAYEAFTDELCACKDKRCADKVVDKMSKWGQEMAKDYKDDKPDAEQMRRITPIAERMSKCMAETFKTETQAETQAEKPLP